MAVRTETTPVGVAYSLGASGLFALLLWWAALLGSLNAWLVLGWRVVLTFTFTAVLLLVTRSGTTLRTALDRLRRPRVWAVHLVTAPLLTVQFGLFMWAPANGHASDISLGFFLMPLVMVPVGKLLFADRLSPWQWTAVVLAVIGAGHEVVAQGGISIVAVIPAIGFPIYFAIRRAAGVSDTAGSITELAFMTPIGIVLLAWNWSSDVWATHPWLPLLVLGMGVISAGATFGYFMAAHLLPFGMFGLLSYVEPSLLLIVALILGEHLTGSDLLTYGPIWLAIIVLALEGAVQVRVRGAR